MRRKFTVGNTTDHRSRNSEFPFGEINVERFAMWQAPRAFICVCVLRTIIRIFENNGRFTSEKFLKRNYELVFDCFGSFFFSSLAVIFNFIRRKKEFEIRLINPSENREITCSLQTTKQTWEKSTIFGTTRLEKRIGQGINAMVKN